MPKTRLYVLCVMAECGATSERSRFSNSSVACSTSRDSWPEILTRMNIPFTGRARVLPTTRRPRVAPFCGFHNPLQCGWRVIPSHISPRGCCRQSATVSCFRPGTPAGRIDFRSWRIAPRPFRRPHRSTFLARQQSYETSSASQSGTEASSPHLESRSTSQSSTAWKAGSSSSAASPTQEPARFTARSAISSSLLGRAVVELCALGIGALLLLFVVCLRFLRWVTNVGRLGKWAWSRSRAVGSALLTAPSVVANAVHTALFDTDRKEYTERRNEDVAAKDITVRSVSLEDDDVVPKAELLTVQSELDRVRTMLERSKIDSGTEKFNSSRRSGGEKESIPASATTADVVRKANSKPLRRLVLMRHAKSTWDRTGEVADFDRKLSPRGCAEATVIGAELRQRGWLPQTILCSSSARTVETLRLLCASAQLSQEVIEPTISESLYFAVSSDEMAAAVDDAASLIGHSEEADSMLCICHNPGCESLIEHLTGEKHHMGTACAALLEELPASADNARHRKSGRESTNLPRSLASQAGCFRVIEVLRPEGLLV